MNKILKAFYFENELYIRLIPAKRLFNSTMVHDVVNRGSIFAMRVSDQQFTVIPGTAQVTHVNFEVRMPLTLTKPQQELFGKEDIV
jgi:uncharacterized protein with WD repeat